MYTRVSQDTRQPMRLNIGICGACVTPLCVSSIMLTSKRDQNINITLSRTRHGPV